MKFHDIEIIIEILKKKQNKTKAKQKRMVFL